MNNLKTCCTCGHEKPATKQYFHSDRHNKDGLTIACRECRLSRKKELNRMRGVRNMDEWRNQSERVCCDCGVKKGIDDFKMYYGLKSHKRVCYECEKIRVKKINQKARGRQKEWAERNREKLNKCSREWESKNKSLRTSYTLRSRIKRAYGITVEQRDSMFSRQGGMCAICFTKITLTQFGYAIDHNHTTGAVRGLLCNNCNRAIGLFKENQCAIRNAADYLDHYNDGA